MNPNDLAPPRSDEAEQRVLGALLNDNTAFDRVGDLLDASNFYHPDHRAIYSTIARLIVSGKAADVVTVYEAGGHDLTYLGQLSQSVAGAAAVRGHAEIVLERWGERELLRMGCDLTDSARRPDQGSVAERVDAAVTGLMKLAHQGVDRGEPIDIGDALGPWLDELTAMAEGETEPGMRTGLEDLDTLTAGGIRTGELWVIGARPSMGKSALTLTLARNMARRYPALFLSQEDSRRTLVSRLVSAAGGVNLADLRNPKRAPESMWSGVTDGVEALKDLRLSIDDQAGLTLLEVRRKVQQVKRKRGLGLVVVDYLQLMVGDGETRNRELGDIANGLKKTAKDLDVGIVLLSQLSRKADERSGPPQMSDLRESGDIEGAADLIGMLYREHMRRPTEENKHYAELHVCKQKNGPTDTVPLHFNGAHQRFTNWAGPRPMTKASRGGSGGMS